MRIHVSKDLTGTFVISFDDTMVTLSGKDLKILLLEIMQAFGSTGQDAIKETNRERFFAGVREADDISLQTLIQVAEHDDMVTLVKLAENDDVVLQKLFINMSTNNRKIFEEDAEYRFREAVPSDDADLALLRLTQICDNLRDQGRADL
jgi:flagellar motor switch protein FliG